MRLPYRPVFLVALGVSACSTSAPNAGSASAVERASSGELSVGDAAPSLVFQLQDGTKVDLASLRGKLVLVYFYPKDDTPGCTVEANGIRDSWDKFKSAGIEVYGVSTQDAKSHQEFIDKHDLPFPLVVDGEAVTRAFGVPLKKGYAARQSFLIGKDGKIAARWLDVDPSNHADLVLAAAKS